MHPSHQERHALDLPILRDRKDPRNIEVKDTRRDRKKIGKCYDRAVQYAIIAVVQDRHFAHQG